jgi:hypothetical protein
MMRILKRLMLIAGLALALIPGPSVADTITGGEILFDGDSLHGSTGSLSITMTGVNTYDVVWTINTTGFDDDGAISTGNTELTHVVFKAFDDISAVSFVSATGITGTETAVPLYPARFNGTCSEGPSGFVCLTLAAPQDMLADGKTYSYTFSVTGILAQDEWSYRGKFGPGTGWVISETAPPIPEPTSAAVFGLGALIVGAALRRRLSA